MGLGGTRTHDLAYSLCRNRPRLCSRLLVNVPLFPWVRTTYKRRFPDSSSTLCLPIECRLWINVLLGGLIDIIWNNPLISSFVKIVMLHDDIDVREMVAELWEDDKPVLSIGIAETRFTTNVLFSSGITSFTTRIVIF